VGGGRPTDRALLQEIYLQDLVLSIYRVYEARLTDAAARDILKEYLRGEVYRGERIEALLAAEGATVPAAPRALFAAAGRLYGRLTALFGTRIMMRILYSSGRRASRRACAAVGLPAPPDLQYLATLKAKNEGDLFDAMRQHLIDTRPLKEPR
jgi:hypothetical protein